jgi:putative phage-type endonuclease
MITAEEKQKRRNFLGASESATVMGLNPFQSVSDLYLIKTGMAEDFGGNEATEAGNFWEPFALEFCSTKLGAPIRPGRMMTDECLPEGSGLLCANPDGIMEATHELVEAKFSTLIDEWGDEGTDQVPHRVTVQAHHQLAVAGPEWRRVWVPVLLAMPRKPEFRMYRIDRDDDLCREVSAEGIRFMREHVLRRVPPEDFRPSLEILKRVKRVPNNVKAGVDDELLDNLVSAKAATKDAKAREEECQRALIGALLPDCDGGRTRTGREFSFMVQDRKGYTVGATSFPVLKLPRTKPL